MRRTLLSHPFRDEVVGGVNSYSLAFTNWLLLGSLMWFTGWILTGDMSGADVERTRKIPGAGVVYAVPTLENVRAVGGIGYTPPPQPSLGLDPTPLPSTISPFPSPTPLPLTTPHPTYEHFAREADFDEWYTVDYSYYNPALGGVNCLTWVNDECVSPLASGDGWVDRIDTGVVAVPPRWITNGLTALGLQIEILHPPQMRGTYDVLDICGGCDKSYWLHDDGRDRIDILASKQVLAWGDPLIIVFLDTLASSEYINPQPQPFPDLSNPP